VKKGMFPVKNILASLLALLLVLTVNTVSARTGNPNAGREKSFLCQGCHGEYGISAVGLIPKLAGQYQLYIEKQVRDYAAGIRSHQIMNAMVATIKNDTDLEDIAAYFTYQRRMAGDGLEHNKAGHDLYRHGHEKKKVVACINCHGVKGKGLHPNIAMFPVIGGQQKEYIKKQLVDFRRGFRVNSPNNIMNEIAAQLTDTDIENLASYISEQ